MSQHIGAPANPVVKAGDTVYVGTLIGEAGGFVSAPVHSSVSGTVKKIEKYLMANGKETLAVVIESDGLMTPDPSIAPVSVTTLEELQKAARDSGLVGLGGAGFPTSVKLAPRTPVDTLVINGAECEPYITSDTRTMIDDAELVREGVLLVASVMGLAHTVVGVEGNKPEAIASLKSAFADDSAVEVVSLPSRYPQGAEKILIANTTGRVVPEGKLPADVGVIVMNVTTVATLAKYVRTGMPLVEKTITLDGSAVNEPANLIVPIGMSVKDVVEAAGGFKCEPRKVLFGGPMMGSAMYSLDSPVMKNCNAIVALDEKDARLPDSTPCIHCGRCVSYCPMGLNPTIFSKSLNLNDKGDAASRLEDARVNLCIECGCCSFVCPAKRPLVENNRLAKSALRDWNAKHNTAN